jgi:hypothetical protein
MRLAILSIGTDLPEVFISIDAALMQLKGVDRSSGNHYWKFYREFHKSKCVLGLSGLF